jgi:ComEC/Rec2-related protein
LVAAIGWLVGSVVGPSVTPSLALVAVGSWLTGLSLLGWLFPLDRRALTLVASCLAALTLSWFLTLDRTPPLHADPLTVSGVLADLLTESGGRSSTLLQVTGSDQSALVGHRVSLRFQLGETPNPGDHIQVTTHRFSGVEVVGLAERDRAAGIVARLEATGPSQRLGRDRSMSSALLRLRARLVTASQTLWPLPESSLAAGLVVGGRHRFSTRFLEAMQRTSTTHIVAVSGTNVGIILFTLAPVLPRRRPWLRVSVLVLTLTAFAVLTGLTASVLRAVTMVGVGVLAGAVGRPVQPLRIVILTAAALALPNPLIVRADLGFQLSFLAVLGLTVVAPVVRGWLIGPRFVRDELSLSFAAHLMTAPLIASQFQTVSLVGPLVNAVLAPLVPLALAGSALTLAGDGLAHQLGQLGAWLTWPLLASITALIERASALVGSSVALGIPTWLAWSLTAAVLVLALWLRSSLREETTRA